MKVTFSFEVSRSFNPAKTIKQVSKAIEEIEDNENHKKFLAAMEADMPLGYEEPDELDHTEFSLPIHFSPGSVDPDVAQEQKDKRREAGLKAAETRRANKAAVDEAFARAERRAKREAAKSAKNASSVSKTSVK
jgi:hypothetical protein